MGSLLSIFKSRGSRMKDYAAENAAAPAKPKPVVKKKKNPISIRGAAQAIKKRHEMLRNI